MAKKWMVYVAHRWRMPKVMLALFIIELPITIALLVFFGIADPDTYRTKLWQNGSDHGFNSNPNEILYAFANYKPISVPLIWSKYLVQFNVVCAVLSMFILLAKSTAFVLGFFIPILSVFTHALLIALYAVSVSNQSTPDLSNKNVPHLQKNLPWYLTKGCSYATPANHGFCMQAVGAFVVTCLMLALDCIYFVFAIYACKITPEEQAERQAEYEEEIELKKYESQYQTEQEAEEGLSPEEKWERHQQMFANLPKTPVTQLGMPTPRTTAFQKLSGNPGEPSGGVNFAGNAPASQPLPFRQAYGDSVMPDGR